MQISSPGSMSLIEGGSHSISRSKIAEDSKADPKGESQGVLPEARSAPTDIIGNVESTSDGRLGVIVSATVVGRAPPTGLILQVQVKPTDGRGAETGDDVADRVRQGLSPQDGPGLAFGVRQQEEMAPAERAEVQEMQSRDASVRREEQAHAAAAGSMAGAIQYEYATGPDGRRYVVNGSVSIEGESLSGDPKEMERKGKRMAAAAMSAQAPSSADYAAAAHGYRAAGEARQMTAANDAEARQHNQVPGFNLAV